MFSIEVKRADGTLYVGDVFDVEAVIDNALDVDRAISLDLSLVLNGKHSDFEYPTEKTYVCHPGKTAIKVLPDFPITRAFIPGSYTLVVVAKDVHTQESVTGTGQISIEPRLFHPAAPHLFKKGESLPKTVWWGHYHAMSATEDGPCRTVAQLNEAIDQIQSHFGGGVGFRNWVLDGRMLSRHPWAMENGKFNLNKWDEVYLQRIKVFTDVYRQRGTLCILDLYDNWRGVEPTEYLNNPLNPRNNHQGTFGLNPNELLFPQFYDWGTHPGLKEFQERYVKKIASIVRDNPYVIISTGNEMVMGDLPQRRLWHQQTAKWVREVSQLILTMENDFTNSVSVHTLPEIDIVSFHACGGFNCTGTDGYAGSPNWSLIESVGKAVILDNDGLWVCRDNMQFVKEWAEETWSKIKQYAAKGPYYRDASESQIQMDWNRYGAPTLQLLNSIL